MGRNVSDPLYQTFKHINLNKIHRSNKRVTRDKESLSRLIMWSSKQKVRKFVAFFTGV